MPPLPSRGVPTRGPPCQWPPFQVRRILARAIGKGGGDGRNIWRGSLAHWCYATGENTDLFPSKRPVFGCVKDGFDVIMKISNTPTDCRDSPQDPGGGFK